MENERAYWIWLASINGIPVKQFWQLIDRFGSAKGVYHAPAEEIKAAKGVMTEKVANQLRLFQKNESYQMIKENEDKGYYHRIITPLDDTYPAKLKRIYDPPKMLFYKGKPLIVEDKVVGIIGSRYASYYGRKMAQSIARELAQQGITVISGLAKGIDAAAHTGAIEGQGYTIGVLGCGIDIVYPKENSKIYREMEKVGTVISEYEGTIPPRAYNFPARNRIVSALSDCILVVEASEKSGAMITVDFALEHGKEIFAVPGNVTSKTSQGTNKLIKEGAIFATGADDILENMGWEKENENNSKKKDNHPAQLDFLETHVYNALKDGQFSPDEIARYTQIPIAEVQSILFRLELNGMIGKKSGGVYEML